MSKLFGLKTSEFDNEALEVHNEYRREHGVPPLVLSKEICKISQKWAEELAKKDDMAYSQNKSYGESIYSGWSENPNTKVKARDCIDKWYSEIKDFSFGKEPEVLNCGHFTQIIWKETKELGIGSAKSKSGKLYVVANYSPPGNYSGQFAKNIPPPGANQFKSTYKYTPTTYLESPQIRHDSPSYETNRKSTSSSKSVATDLPSKVKSMSLADDSFHVKCLEAHNNYRKKHGVPPLTLNKKISDYSEEWAKELVKKGRMEHRKQKEYGENIFYSWSSNVDHEVSGSEAVDNWYSEIKDYTFGKEPSNFSQIGHFTQVVWEDTKEMGVGIARSNDGYVYVVANYKPPGNMVGSFHKKVPTPK